MKLLRVFRVLSGRMLGSIQPSFIVILDHVIIKNWRAVILVNFNLLRGFLLRFIFIWKSWDHQSNIINSHLTWDKSLIIEGSSCNTQTMLLLFERIWESIFASETLGGKVHWVGQYSSICISGVCIVCVYHLLLLFFLFRFTIIILWFILTHEVR